MPSYKGIEVWIEDSEHQKIDYQEVSINLVDSDDQTVTAKTELPRNELYTVHCQSPMAVSILCDVFVIAASQLRKSAARFYLDGSLAVSENVTNSSINRNVDSFREYGLRTPKRQFQQGKLGTVEVEIRRIGEIVKGGPGGEAGVDFVMVDEPNQPPWLVFRFEIRVKGLQAASAPTAKPTRKYAPRKMKQIQATGERPNKATPRYSHSPKKHPRDHDESSSASGSNINSDLLRQEYQEEEAEECRLLQKLQERLQNKRARNDELRRLLGETD
ncbi:hypothetical protein EV363DRAFT_1160551 [Boletus edulis]|nr:hypothetical protein EV363DRAFT_1160551 [Boletus edulis]